MVIDRLAPSMAQLMDREAVRDAAFCHRHREVTREHGKELAAQRLEEAKRSGAEWVTLFDDVTPLGAQRLEMHVRSGRALHTSASLPLDGTRPEWELEVVQLDPQRRRLAAGQAAAAEDPEIRPSRRMGGARQAGPVLLRR